MKCTLRILSFLLVCALLLSVTQPVLAQEKMERTGLRPDAPQYAIRGPHWVGYRPLLIGEGTDDEMEADLWYPALNPEGLAEEIAYDPESQPIAGHALLDARLDDSDSPYPLIVFSHGFGATPTGYSTLIEHYVSHGFIVLAPRHINEADWMENVSTTAKRPFDIQNTLDYAEEINAPEEELAGAIDMENVAVVGHSYGGYTALAAAGAQFDLESLAERCATLSEDDPNIFLCMPLLGNEQELAKKVGVADVPAGLWPSLADSRVSAIVSLAGDSYIFDKTGLSKIEIPMMAMGGTADTGTPYDWGVKPSYDNAASNKKALVTLVGAEHVFASNLCDNMPHFIGTPMYEFVCLDPVWDKTRMLDLTNHFTTAFLLDTLKGDTEAAAALAPEAVSFPGIEYQAQGYSTETALDPGLVADIEAFVEQEMAERLIPGAALGIVQDGELVYAKGFGVKELGGDDPVTPDTDFLISSVSKSFTGVGIMQLVEQGLIDLDAPVTEYLPYFTLAEPESREMTIRQLLSHTSGMPDCDNEAEYASGQYAGEETDLEEYIRSYSDQSLLFDPGEDWAYSTVGIDVLGDVIAKVTGMTFEEYMNENVLGPIGMSNSTFLIDEIGPGNRATPHRLDDSGEQSRTMDYVAWLRHHGPGDGLFTTVNDLARFAIANMNQGEIDGVIVLPASAYDEMWKAQTPPTSWIDWLGSRFNTYGLGWWVGEDGGYKAIGNYGADNGYNAHIEILPELGVAVIFLGNFMDFDQLIFNSNEVGSAVAVMVADYLSGNDQYADIEALVEQTMVDLDIPGVSVGIVKDGEIAYAKGYGVAEYGADRPVTPQTQFAAACVTKGFTTAAIMQLVDQGLIDLNAPVTDYLPYFKLADDRYKEITIHHLLANTAGLPMPDYVALNGGFSENPTWQSGLLEEYVRSLADKPMTADPADNTFVYGGDYFDILGDVIAKVTGQPFEEYMTERFLEPLGLEHTTFIVDDLDPALVSAAHWTDENGELQISTPAPTYYPAQTPSNGMFSTTEDLLKWAIFNLNRGEFEGQQIVPASAWDEMWTPKTEIPWGGIFQHWGYGWGISDVDDHQLVFWGGGHIGSPNAYYLMPEENMAVHVFSNRSPEPVKGNETADAIAYPIVELLLGMNTEASASD